MSTSSIAEHPPLVGEPLARPSQPQYFDELLEPPTATLRRDAEHPVLLGHPAEPEPEVQPPAGDVVQHGGVLCDAERVVEGRKHHRGPDLEPFGHGRDGGEERQQRRDVSVRRAVMLGEPERVEADALGESRELERVGVQLRVAALVPRRDLKRELPETELHSRAKRSAARITPLAGASNEPASVTE